MFKVFVEFGMTTNDVSDYINLLVRIAHIICNHALLPPSGKCRA
jgi:hypothetical protein